MAMATKLFVNLPVKDLKRSEQFFTDLGFEFFGMTEDMASVIISEPAATSHGARWISKKPSKTPAAV